MSRLGAAFAVAISLGSASVGAQTPASRPNMVAGRVVTPVQGGTRPVRDAWVTLHRVGTDTAGALDSMRTDAAGRYSFRYFPTGSTDAAYFVTASHDGIAYFAPPVIGSDVRGDAAEITVFDTTSSPILLRVRGRHIAVAEPSDGKRLVIEVYEISNDTIVTRVAGTPERPTFTAIVPANATDVRVGQGDVPGDATRAERGRLLVFAPFAPGLKQLSFSYLLDDDDFPLAIPLSTSTEVLEVLLEDPGASVEGAGLQDLGEVSTEGRRFHRYLGHTVAANTVVRISVPPSPMAPSGWGLSVTVLMALLALAMLVALARGVTRAPSRARATAPPLTEAERIAREIARLDATSPHDNVRRNELKAQLTQSLARDRR